MDNIAPGEERLPLEDLCKDAADAPDIDGRRVLCEKGATQLRRPIPSANRKRLSSF